MSKPNKFINTIPGGGLEGSQIFINQYLKLEQEALEVFNAAHHEHRINARKWGSLHKIIGLAAVVSSALSAVLLCLQICKL